MYVLYAVVAWHALWLYAMPWSMSGNAGLQVRLVLWLGGFLTHGEVASSMAFLRDFDDTITPHTLQDIA
jgi:hypothetical protein